MKMYVAILVASLLAGFVSSLQADVIPKSASQPTTKPISKMKSAELVSRLQELKKQVPVIQEEAANHMKGFDLYTENFQKEVRSLKEEIDKRNKDNLDVTDLKIKVLELAREFEAQMKKSDEVLKSINIRCVKILDELILISEEISRREKQKLKQDQA